MRRTTENNRDRVHWSQTYQPPNPRWIRYVPEPDHVRYGPERKPYAVQSYSRRLTDNRTDTIDVVADPGPWLTEWYQCAVNHYLTLRDVVKVTVTDRRTGQVLHTIDRIKETDVAKLKTLIEFKGDVLPRYRTSPTGAMVRLWAEPDAARRKPDAEKLHQAWDRLFGPGEGNGKVGDVLGKETKGDVVDYFYSAGRIVRQRPEGSEIWAVTEWWAPWLLELEG